MHTGDLHRSLIAVPGPPSYAVQRQRARGYRPRMLVRDSQAHEYRPPVVHQGRDARHSTAAHWWMPPSTESSVFDVTLCRSCKRTVSLLPEFAFPWLRFSVSVIALFLV